MAILDLNWAWWNEKTQSKEVGFPLPHIADQRWPYQRIADAAPEYAQAGFQVAKFQPSTLGAAGVFSGGYDKKDDYDFNGTSWGSEAMCRAAVDALHKAGMQAYGDLVLHQMDGYAAQEYRTTLFPKSPFCFARVPGTRGYPGNVAPDSVPDAEGGWPDGDLCAYVQPNRYMWNGAIAATLHQIATLGFDGFRLDEAKDLNAEFLRGLIIKVRARYPKTFFIGEYFDGNPAALGGWVNWWMHRLASVFDFMFKFNIGTICNNNSNADMGRLANIGYNLIDAETAVTFVESADTDNTPGEQIIDNKMLAYAVQLTMPGNPMIYYRDWSTDANCYGLKAGINNLLWINAHLAQGQFVVRHADFQTFAHERLGYGEAPGCVCFFNNDQYNSHTVRVQTRYPANTRLHEFTGNAGYNTDLWTDHWGCLTVNVPRNVNGCNSLVYGVYL